MNACTRMTTNMETDIKLTKISKCAGCGAKVGAGVLASMLSDFNAAEDTNQLVGFDKSDDASVYKINDEVALVSTTDFFPPIADDPYLFGQIAATNALSDVYAMGGEPKTALNIMCLPEKIDDSVVHEILRGGYDKAYEAGVVISGGHTIHGNDLVYGLSVSGFVNPSKVLTNSNSKAGDVLILTKPLGVGIITTAAKASMVSPELLDKVYKQMTSLNKYAAEIMSEYPVNACTDVTGFSLLGHSLEMAQGSGVSIRLDTSSVKYIEEAYELASMGFIPAGAYRNREFVTGNICVAPKIPLPLEDILYDPQTSGGLLISIPESDADSLLEELRSAEVDAFIVGSVTPPDVFSLYVQ